MKSAIDSAGRLVIPKPLREALRLEKGTPVEIKIRGGCLEVVPAALKATVVKKGRLNVIRPKQKVPALKTAEVETTLAQLRGDIE